MAGFFGGFRECTDLSENGDGQEKGISQEALDKYDSLMGDTSIKEFKETKENSDVENPTTYLITRNEGLEGDIHPVTGVPFERKVIELNNGEIIEGVFPEFDSAFETVIPEELYVETDYKQFKECNAKLLDATEADPDLKKMFSEEQLEQIKDGVSDGSAPDGYVWHHCPEPGVIKLVDYETHATTGHTGGRSVWGGGTENR